MALDNAALLEVLEAMQVAGVEDRVQTAAQTIYQALIDAELTAVIGAGPWERTEQRTTQRNGSRSRTLTTAYPYVFLDASTCAGSRQPRQNPSTTPQTSRPGTLGLRFPPDRRGIDNEDRDAREAEEVRPGVP